MDIEPFRKAHKKAVLEHFEKDGIDCLSLYSATSFSLFGLFICLF